MGNKIFKLIKTYTTVAINNLHSKLLIIASCLLKANIFFSLNP